MPVYFPSFAEPIQTANQYLDFAQLGKGDVVLDLGAYSGLTSILFKEQVGENGVVIAVDADAVNVKICAKNFENYYNIKKYSVDKLLHACVWSHSKGVSFASEGNMGSSAISLINRKLLDVNKVRSTTLTDLMRDLDLKYVNFIKCDIEGGELELIKDIEFFNQHKPKIIMETHDLDGIDTAIECRKFFETMGYECRIIEQYGVGLPLLTCTPR